MSRSPERKEHKKAISTGFEPAPSIRRQLAGTPLGRKPLYHKILIPQGLEVEAIELEAVVPGNVIVPWHQANPQRDILPQAKVIRSKQVIRKRLLAGFEPATPSERDMIDRFERSFPAIVSSDAYP